MVQYTYVLVLISLNYVFSQLPQLEQVICDGNHKGLHSLTEGDLCSMLEKYSYIIHLGLVAIGTLLGALTIVLYFRFKYQLKILLLPYKIGKCLIPEEEIDRKKKFDVFISYTHQDEEFLKEYILPRLEPEPHNYQVCIHIRDFYVGGRIDEQIIKSVASSRRTIVLLSRNYLKSRWAILEFYAAYKQALRDRHARVIVVLKEDLKPDEIFIPELKTYITMNTYLKWGESSFWEKLYKALPRANLSKKQPNFV